MPASSSPSSLRTSGEDDWRQGAGEARRAGRSPRLRRRHQAALASTGPLTERQAEVLALVARGLSNREIAAGLTLSEHTVHRHLANIYNALDLASRAAAAAYAVARGLG